MTDNNTNLWSANYAHVKQTLQKFSHVNSVATAFNTNIDAVIKVKADKMAQLAVELGLSWEDINQTEYFSLKTPADIVKGFFRCFSKGIAEEWLADKDVYDFMVEHIGFDRLQMGGQGGIVANVMAVCGVRQVYNHCSSLPKLQASLFLDLDNLLSFDEKGVPQKAQGIDRKDDIPLIHWIMEFDKDDEFVLGNHKIKCPKANRFIATYDPLNSHLVMDMNFVNYLNENPAKIVVLSGYHSLTSEENGVALVENSVPIIKKWQKAGSLIHLEVASTQDIEVRRAIVEKIASFSDSIGLNERESIDVLVALKEDDLAQICETDSSAINLFEAILKIKQKVKCRRIQLHMFGLYLTVQDKDFPISPKANREGMCLAAVAAAGKAGTGHLNTFDNLMWAFSKDVCKQGLDSLKALGDYIGDSNFIKSGIGAYEGFDIIAVPTILVEKPLTLVGMGDTISSISFVGAVAAND